MSDQEKIDRLEADLRFAHPEIYPVAERAREVVRRALPAASNRHGVLEGKGKFRRHIKLRSADDVEATHLAEYVAMAAAL